MSCVKWPDLLTACRILNSTCVKKRFNVHAEPGITFERPARTGTEDGAGIVSRKGRGPTQWGGHNNQKTNELQIMAQEWQNKTLTG